MSNITSINNKDLSGIALDWAVAKCEGYFTTHGQTLAYWESNEGVRHFLKMREIEEGCAVHWTRISTNSNEFVLIIENNKIATRFDREDSLWQAVIEEQDEWIYGWGNILPIAAMRCYVASKLGDMVDIPSELLAS